MSEHTHTVELTDKEIGLLREALDSHIYWQLSDQSYRNSGFVLDPGSDDPEMREEILAAMSLDTKLEAVTVDEH